ncbi:MAG: cobyrinate a,c-diamide synthase [Eubacterium sp.]|nr:cobyrinate a,c-diamide synthase [Eubacterium sp.]
MSQRRILLAAPASGSGKTLITCGLLQLLKQKQYAVQSFKCGPDFIDPMFHAHITGQPAGNLDAFMAEPAVLRRMLAEGAGNADVTVIEGVMGCFDGVSFGSSAGSSCDVAGMTATPVILIVNARGMSTTLLPLISGMLQYPGGNVIRGVILNQISPGIYPAVKKMIEDAMPVRVVGYLPVMPEVRLDSRHLGLLMPEEIETLDLQLQLLAERMDQTVDLDALFAIAQTAGALSLESGEATASEIPDFGPLRIGVAKDSAFCFFYAENLRMLTRAGAELVYFSPVSDTALPDNLHALLLCGGYPELHAEALSRNAQMRTAVRCAAEAGMPVLAECGGFLYLHDTLEDLEGRSWPMCGVIHAHAFNNRRLTRFGYITLQNGTFFGQETGPVRAHEFHHYESSDPGHAFFAVKPGGKRSWHCAHSTGTMYAGFPHLFYPANPGVAEAFLRAAAGFRDKQKLLEVPV